MWFVHRDWGPATVTRDGGLAAPHHASSQRGSATNRTASEEGADWFRPRRNRGLPRVVRSLGPPPFPARSRAVISAVRDGRRQRSTLLGTSYSILLELLLVTTGQEHKPVAAGKRPYPLPFQVEQVDIAVGFKQAFMTTLQKSRVAEVEAGQVQ